jgi:hypothetical protein
MTTRRNQNAGIQPFGPRNGEGMSDASMDQAYGQRARGGWEVNKTVSISVIIALVTWTVSGVWFAATQNANINTHSTAIAQLQANEKENDKQRVEILLHLSNMDQSLKDILNYGLPRNAQVYVPPGTPTSGNTIIQQAPVQQPVHPAN